MANIFRSPIANSIPKLPSQQPDAVQNMLTLRPPNPAQPWHQDDWPSCVRANPPQDSYQPSNRFPYINLNPTQPWHQDDWPAAVRGKEPHRWEPPSSERPLLTPNPSRPWHQDDWPTPWKGKPSALVDVVTDVLSILQPNPSRPFHQDDWATPLSVRRSVQTDVYVKNPVAAVVVSAPFFETNWPSPQRPGQPQEADAPGPMLALQFPNPTRPFAQSDYPNPAKIANTALETLSSGNSIDLTPAVVTPPTPAPETGGGGGGRLPKRLRKYLYGKRYYRDEREALSQILEDLLTTAAQRKAAAENAGPAAVKMPPVKIETGEKQYVQMFAMAPAFMSVDERGDFRSVLLALNARKAAVDKMIREAMELAIEIEDEEFLLMLH